MSNIRRIEPATRTRPSDLCPKEVAVNPGISDVRNEARLLIDRGYAVVPLVPREKYPSAKEWPTHESAPSDFKPDSNIGVILGERSDGLVDIDLDDPIAQQLADKHLPSTDAVTGRASAPRSHRWYVCRGAKTRKWSLPKHGMIVELRSDGHQTAVGPSIHPSGEKYTELRGEPATVDADELTAACEKLYHAVCERYGVEPKSKPDAVKQPAPWERHTPAQPAPNTSPASVGQEVDDVEQRARAYLDACPPAVSGQGGHPQTLEVTQALVRGFELSDEVALRLLSKHYNPRCEPPWSEKELRHKIESAREHPCDKPAGWLLNSDGSKFSDSEEAAGYQAIIRVLGNELRKHTAAGTPTCTSGDAPEASDNLSYSAMTCAEMMDREFETRFLVDRVLVAGQPCILAGPKKCLKTSVLIDLALSLAAGGFFLGKFKVPEAVSFGLMSGESGMATIKETVGRISRTAKIDARSLTNLVITSQVPQLTSRDHLRAINEFIIEHSLKVLAVDPTYLAMPGVDAGNLFVQGERLRSITEVCSDRDVTLILCHHTRKNMSDPFGMPELDNIAWAGFAEFARQWVLLGRRELYVPGTGEHRLWLTVGGSAGHSGGWGLDVDEGNYQDEGGRVWETTVQCAAEIYGAQKERRNQEKADEKRAAHDDRCKRVYGWLCKHPEGATKTKIRGSNNLNTQQMTEVIDTLLESGSIELCKVVTGNNAKHDGYRAVREGEEQKELFD